MLYSLNVIFTSGELLLNTSQVAFQQADFTGWNLWAAINDRPLLPFRLAAYTLSSIILASLLSLSLSDSIDLNWQIRAIIGSGV